jgi:CubicO group peptidase (beta-lactamase class C family)
MPLRRCILQFVFAMVIGLLASAGAVAGPPDDATLQSKVDALAAEALKRPGAVGLSIGVARGGKVILAKGYGLADVEFEAPANEQTMFRIGSVTKQYTAAAIMRLVEQDKINLNDDLSKYLPDFPLQGSTVTICHLLNHTSGIPSYTDVGEEWQKVWPLELTHEQLLALVKDKPFDFTPGVDWAYNNTAYYMLGMIIEKVSGKTYPQFMQDEIFTTLNLERTRCDSNSDVIKNRAQGYAFSNGVLTNDIPLGMNQPGAAGMIISTGGEMVEWSMALASGKIVKPESFKMMATPTILPDGKNTNYGFGLMIDEFEGRKRIHHGGGIFGFNSMLVYLPDDDLHVAVVSNGETVSSGRLAAEIAREALGIQKFVAADQPISAELMKSIVGQYRLAEIEMNAKVWEEDGKAMLQASAEGQGAFRLLWQGADVGNGREFRASFDNDVTMTFAEDGQSFTLKQGGRTTEAKRID